MSETIDFNLAQAEELLEHYQACLHHLGDDELTERKIRRIRRELKDLGYRIAKDADGVFYLSPTAGEA